MSCLQAWLWSPTAVESWLQLEEKLPGWGGKSCAPQIISSEGIIWHFICTACSSTEQARGHQYLWMKLPPCYLPVPKAFNVWDTEGSLLCSVQRSLPWGSRGGTSRGSKLFSEPSTNYRWTLNQPLSCTPWTEPLDAYHNMHLLIAFSYPEGTKALLACFGSERHPSCFLIIGAVVSDFIRPTIPSKSTV